MTHLNFENAKTDATIKALCERLPNAAGMLAKIRDIVIYGKDEDAIEMYFDELVECVNDARDTYLSEFQGECQATIEHSRSEAA